MNDGTGRRCGLRWWWQRAGLLAIVAGLALPTAACGSRPSPRPGPGAYSGCLRKHGVTGAFASPPGMHLRTSMPTASQSAIPVPSKVAAAMQACQSLAQGPGQFP
jgi:hypothetical protein